MNDYMKKVKEDKLRHPKKKTSDIPKFKDYEKLLHKKEKHK